MVTALQAGGFLGGSWPAAQAAGSVREHRKLPRKQVLTGS